MRPPTPRVADFHPRFVPQLLEGPRRQPSSTRFACKCKSRAEEADCQSPRAVRSNDRQQPPNPQRPMAEFTVESTKEGCASPADAARAIRFGPDSRLRAIRSGNDLCNPFNWSSARRAARPLTAHGCDCPGRYTNFASRKAWPSLKSRIASFSAGKLMDFECRKWAPAAVQDAAAKSGSRPTASCLTSSFTASIRGAGSSFPSRSRPVCGNWPTTSPGFALKRSWERPVQAASAATTFRWSAAAPQAPSTADWKWSFAPSVADIIELVGKGTILQRSIPAPHSLPV